MKIRFAAFFLCICILLCSCSSGADTAGAEAQSEPETVYDVTQASFVGEDLNPEAFGIEKASADETDTADGIHYFTFCQSSISYTDENDRELLVETLTKPAFFADDPQLDQWVNGILNLLYEADAAWGQELLGQAQNAAEESEADSFYSYSHYVSMGIGRHDSTLISLLSLDSTYAGGTNPSLAQTAYNLDLRNMRLLGLEDVLCADAAPALAQLVQTSVEAKFSDALSENYEDTIQSALVCGNMTPYWYLNAEGLVIFFNPYTLGANASGIIRVVLPYDQLEQILAPEYFPEEYLGVAQGAAITAEPSEGERVRYVDLGEGDTVYLRVSGEAAQVQLSQVLFVEQTPVGESMLFSANYVDEATTLAVTGDLSDPEKIYALEYSDQNGGPYVRYIQNAQVLDTLPSDGQY